MRSILKLAACLFLGAGLVYGQQPTFHDALLDHMTGSWVLRGTIMGQQNTHDITGEWALLHQYLRIHEVSREKNAKGEPDYEASPYIGWDQAASEYVCIWLDSYGGMYDANIAHAKRNGNEIHFIFRSKDGIFHTRMIYHPESNSWEWVMDSEEKGGLKPFMRAKLTRK